MYCYINLDMVACDVLEVEEHYHHVTCPLLSKQRCCEGIAYGNDHSLR